jgi:hypothetical protein
MNKFSMARDINGYNGFGLMFSTNDYQGILIDGVEQTLTVPNPPDAGFSNVLAIFTFSPGSMIWVALNATATAPSGDISACSSEANPTSRWVKGGDVLHFITNDASDEYGVTFYSFN